VFPKPVRDRRVPVVVGGNSDAAEERVGVLAELCADADRDVAQLWIAVALEGGGDPQDVPALAELGADELVLVEAPPEDPGLVGDWIRGLASRWGVVPV
jgi:hypothetical protein